MEPRIEILSPKKLIGKRIRMSLSDNRTTELWRSFMQRRKEITNKLTTDLISMQVYDKDFDFKTFTPATVFDKWAATEVSGFDDIPEGFETYLLTGGLYAVFLYKGLPQDFADTFHYIFDTWIPQSGYEVDSREHFELLGDKYSLVDPSSEEEIWVPVRSIQ